MTKDMTGKKITFVLFIALTMLISVALLRAQSSEPSTNGEQAAAFNVPCDWLCQLKERQAQQLEGSWAGVVIPALPPGAPPQPARPIYHTFARGGAFIGSDRLIPFGSPQHGVWEHRGGNEFAYTLIQDAFNATGIFQGTLKVRVKITLTGKDEFIGVTNAQVRDVAGNLTLDGCATIKAQRIKVEPLAEPCQSITPPQ